MNTRLSKPGTVQDLLDMAANHESALIGLMVGRATQSLIDDNTLNQDGDCNGMVLLKVYVRVRERDMTDMDLIGLAMLHDGGQPVDDAMNFVQGLSRL